MQSRPTGCTGATGPHWSGFALYRSIDRWLMAEQVLPDDFKEFLRLLTEADVEYLLIGGYAVGYHGYPRTTADMDVWVAISPDNAARLFSMVKSGGGVVKVVR